MALVGLGRFAPSNGSRLTPLVGKTAMRLQTPILVVLLVSAAFPPSGGFFGAMSRDDWQRWAYKLTDHHLRQFGL